MSEPEGLVNWPLVGREAQMTAFEQALADRRAQGFAIYGPAGAGKSCLADECLRHAVQAGMRGRRVLATAAAATVPLGAIAHLVPDEVDLTDPVAGFPAVARALADPERRRLVVLVDDLHLLDSASAVLLRQLMDAGVVFMIATIRSDEMMSVAATVLLKTDAVYRVDLEGLDQQAVEALLLQVLGGPVGRRTVQELMSASNGNPLYLRELVLGSLANGRLASDGEVWELAGGLAGTGRLTELVRHRLADADEEARPVLELLAACEPISLPDAEAEVSTQVLAQLERVGIIQSTFDGRRITVRLAHPLYGETLRDGISEERHRALLLRQVERIEGHGARRRSDPLHIATWRMAATGSADPILLTHAAALARHAHDYQQVVLLLKGLASGDRTVRSRLLLGDALLELGRFEQADLVLTEAHENARTESEVLATVRARTYNLYWMGARVQDALSVNNEARSQVTSADGQEILLLNEASMLAVSGQPARAAEMLASLPNAIEDAPDVDAWLIGAQMKSAALATLGHTDAALQLTKSAYEAHLRVNETALVPHPASELISMVLAFSEAGRFTTGLQTGSRASDELLATGAWFPQLWLTLHMARSEWMAGHPATARHLYAETAAQARSFHHIKALRLVLSGLAASAAVMGDLDAAHAAVRESASFPHMGYLSGEERLGEAWLRAASGDLPGARSTLTEAAQSAHAAGHVTSEALLLTDVARLGAPHEVSTRLSELAAMCDGGLAPARAAFAAALAANDPEALMNCCDAFEAMGADLLAAEASTVAGAAWRAADQPRRATSAIVRAHSALAHCQGAQTPLLSTVAPSTANLTRREHEVATLAAAGISSKDIASKLTLSVRTIDNHLQRIYTKVGVTTRSQLAEYLKSTPQRPVSK
ncbi:LuxR C-terminal-related transcriptional regulator [Streptomyces sp. NPDC058664]|uniref:LuxR C-terminal-related transcriptional regulator n=1 Tax=unclassified Streptomyces TaxID=2593676 RepID=UPI0036622F23